MFSKLCLSLKNGRLKKQQNKMIIDAKSVVADAEILFLAHDSAIQRAAEKSRGSDSDSRQKLVVAVAAAHRHVGLTPYEAQVAGASVLQGRSVAEMQTGEGKTLTAALSAASHALTGKKVHIATVNDYLAGRDAEKLKTFYEGLGLSVSHARSDVSSEEKKLAYQADVVYATAQELGFDYLRDHLVESLEKVVQPRREVIIIDEIDSILIDEAGTPLVLSGAPQDDGGLYEKLIRLVSDLTEGEHYQLDKKEMFVDITESGFDLIEERLLLEELIYEGESLHQSQNLALAHSVNSALAAITLYRKDIEYMVRDGQIVIVDEHTGRALKGRRWSSGLHQAVEAKEGIPVEADPPQLANITYQSFFCLYEHVCGLTGTAHSERPEFASQYGLDVSVIPPHRPVQRKDELDAVYATAAERDKAVVDEVLYAQKKKQPVLIGTSSVEASEALFESLRSFGVTATVLNAKNHDQEAQIIADAGRPGTVTIATQMAGRGTDIILGGSLESALAKAPSEDRHQAIKDRWADDRESVINAGGLYVIGTARAPSRRVDRQLRGRSGRQGDPGVSQFFLSIEDEFIKTFAGDKLDGIVERFGVQNGEALEGKMIDRIIFHAQTTRENIDRSVRQQLVKYDGVASNQRAIVYQVRDEWLAGLEGSDADSFRTSMVKNAIEAAVVDMCARYLPDDPMMVEKINSKPLVDAIARKWNLKLADNFFSNYASEPEKIPDYLLSLATAYYDHRKTFIREQILPVFERISLIEGLDRSWQKQQEKLDILRDGISLRSFANENPAMAFQKEAGSMFEDVFVEARVTAGEVLLGARIPGKNPVEKAA